MDGYLQFFNKSTAKATLSFFFQNVRSVTYNSYVGKTKTDFDLRVNNHRKDVYKADASPASSHFAMKSIPLIET